MLVLFDFESIIASDTGILGKNDLKGIIFYC
jgi:hypothetical protein